MLTKRCRTNDLNRLLDGVPVLANITAFFSFSGCRHELAWKPRDSPRRFVDRSCSAVHKPRCTACLIACSTKSGDRVSSEITSTIVRSRRATRMPSIVPNSSSGSKPVDPAIFAKPVAYLGVMMLRLHGISGGFSLLPCKQAMLELGHTGKFVRGIPLRPCKSMFIKLNN